MKTTIYANYGILAAEKRCIYTAYRILDVPVSEALTVEIPDDLYYGKDEADIALLKIDGDVYALDTILAGDKRPCLIIPVVDRKTKRIPLKVCRDRSNTISQQLAKAKKAAAQQPEERDKDIKKVDRSV